MTALFLRMIVRPLAAEKLRTALAVAAVALGVAVVIAIELASEAAAGSFRSSMETLSGPAQIEIAATGGVEESLLGTLATLPYPLTFAPRVEGFAQVASTRAVVPLIGVDLLQQSPGEGGEGGGPPDLLRDDRAVWASRGLGIRQGDKVDLIIDDRTVACTVRGLLDLRDHAIVMDVGAAQLALGRQGRLDRIDVRLPEGAAAGEWVARLRPHVPAGIDVRPRGTATEENRKMLAAFRWNLRVLSTISLVVGAFLIYNAISVSVVRRRGEIGIVRALGVTRGQVLALFLCEGAMFGAAGGVLGLVLGRWMAEAAVRLLGTTVQQLYVSSRPGDIALSAGVVMEALAVGLGATLAAAFAPAREASRIAPVEAMARGQRQHRARLRVGRDLGAALVLAAAAAALCRLDAWDGRPVAGYAAAFLLIAASALAMPGAITLVSRTLSSLAGRIAGIEGRLAARSLWASLDRSSVLIGALSTAIAMMVSVGIMVGSFRETVAMWMEGQLQADLYIRSAAGGGANRYPTMGADAADRIEAIAGVRDVDRFRVYEIRYNGLPALLGGGESRVVKIGRHTGLLPGTNRDAVLTRLPQGDYAIVSEPFANKHKVRVGQTITVRLASGEARLEVIGIYYDYSNERGYIIVDRATLLRHLPDPSPSSLAVYLQPDADPAAVRREIERALAGRQLAVFSNASLREEALRIFDRTFAVTWVLEAVAILVAVLGVAGALVALVMDRRREIGVLRFLGASAQQVRRLVLVEAGMLGLLATAAGLALGYALSLILIYVINVQSFGWTIRFHWPLALLPAALSLIYAATVLAGIYPARMAAALNPIEVIHEE